MSRIGKIPVSVPSGVDVKVQGSTVKVKGPKGELIHRLHDGISASLDESRVVFVREQGRERELSAFHGLDRALVQNMVIGVSQGFTKKLEVVGTGYNAKLVGDHVELQIGFVHPVAVPIPEGLNVEVPQPTSIVISGSDKQMVGELAAVIRKKRPPEPYKGKGIRYEGEQVRRKAGKTGVAGA
ncbi:MAG: 50S ribosomal protein L6 [Planctomycetota bacterium]